MRYFVILFILIFNLNTFSQGYSDIYCSVFNDIVIKDYKNKKDIKHTFIILKNPNYLKDVEEKDYERFKSFYRNLDKHMFLDFVKKNEKILNTKHLEELNYDIVFLDKEKVYDRKQLLSNYPNWNLSILEFSNIGFNKKRNLALVYYGFDSVGGVGGGAYLIYKRRGGKWKLKKIIPSWSS